MKPVYAILVEQEIQLYGLSQKTKVYLWNQGGVYQNIQNAYDFIEDQNKKHFEAFGEQPYNYTVMGTSDATNFALPIYFAMEGTVGYYPHSNLTILD